MEGDRLSEEAQAEDRGGCDAGGREEPEGRTMGPTKGVLGENPHAAQTQPYTVPRRTTGSQ